jgi:hypothetical protein
MYNKLDEAHGDGSLPKEKVDVKVDDDNSIAETTKKESDVPSKKNDLTK